MKKVFLLFAAIFTATVFNLRAENITSWTIAGDQAMMGSYWDPADTNNDMRVFGGSYQLKKFVNLTEGDYGYKAVANHQESIKDVPSSGYQTVVIEADGDYIVTFTLDAAGTTLTAEAELYTSEDAIVDTYVNDESMGRVTGGGEYAFSSNVTLTAVPNAGYKFVNWSGDQTGTTNPLTFKVTTVLNGVQANFEEETPAGPDTLDYLHFVSLKAGGSVKMSKKGTPAEPVLEYSKDNRKSWSKFDIANGTTFDHVGDTIWFRAGKDGVAGTNATISSSMQKYYTFAFGENDSIAAGGNIMSLLDGTCKQDSTPEGCFAALFSNAKQLVSAPELPATKLAGFCYMGMFKNTGLVVAPELPATTIAQTCYRNMFDGCTNLETAPTSLPALIMKESCYYYMFNGCTNLKHAPTIKITNLHKYCFQSMFEGCTNLQVDTISASCDGAVLEINHEGSAPESWNVNMFTGCKGSAVYNITAGGHYCVKEYVPEPDMHDFLHFTSRKADGTGTVQLNKKASIETVADLTATFEYSKDRKNWTEYTWGDWISSVATGAAIALNQGDTVFFRAKGENGKNATMGYSFNAYFRFAFGADDSIAAGGNTMSLYDAKCEQDTMTAGGFYNLFSTNPSLVSVSELKLPAKKLAEDCYYTMFEKCTSLTTAPELPATTLPSYCYNGMFKDCSALTQAPELNATTLAYQCCYQMFQNCTALTVAPALPATKIAERCYACMFEGCTSLTAAPELKADSLANLCYYKMFSGCTSLQVDTCADGNCDGAKLEPTHSGTGEPTSWSKKMFDGCHGAYTNIKLGGHYCIKEFVPDSIKGIELVAVDTQYDGQNHNIQVNGTIAGDQVTYSTDSATWKQDTIKLKNVSEQTVFVRVQRTDHYDWYGKSSIKIAEKELTVDSTTVADKTYDGKTDATVTGSKLVGVVQGESVGLDVRGEFNDKKAGEDKDVTVEYKLDGSEVVISNYTLQKESETLKATITPQPLTVAGTTASEKEYDGNTSASVTAGTLSGMIESDDVQISTATGAFEDKNAGENKNVIITYTLSGSDSQNYSTPTDTIQANITPKQLTVSGTTVASKTYDGMFDAEATVGTVEGIVSGEGIQVTATAYFNDRNAGYSKDVTVEYSVEGEGYTNYQAPQADYTTAIINKRPIIIASSSAFKVFDGSPLTNDTVKLTKGSWVDDEGATFTATGSQTKVGSSSNNFTVNPNEGTILANYDITYEYGLLKVFTPIQPVIEGMYDQWNIVLDVNQLTDTLLTFINGVTLLPENVTWYQVIGDVDKVNEVTGSVDNDEHASPAQGFYHTEGKAMNGQYYCVVNVPEAAALMGISYFQSNVVFIQTPAPTTPVRKAIQNGQLIIIKDDAVYNAQGSRL